MDDDPPDWLARYGGWILLVFGIVLVATSIAIADKQALATVLAFSGVAAAVFGVLLSRLEGAFEFSPTKFAATLKDVRGVGLREDLTLEERADLMLKLVDVHGELRDSRQAEIPQPARRRAAQLPSSTEAQPPEETPLVPPWPNLPRPIPFKVAGGTDAVSTIAMAFERHVERVYREGGWQVETLDGRLDAGFDMEARRGEWTLLIEAKLRRRLSMADAQQFVGAVSLRDDPPTTRYVYAVNASALSAFARHVLRSVPRIAVWEVDVEGW